MGIYADRLLLEQKQDQAFLQAINEVYFGHTSGIDALFNLYCDWREPLVSKTKYYTGTLKNIYNKDMQVFRENTCKQFGFRSFSYSVLPFNNVNSFTFTSLLPTRAPNMITIDKNYGYKFKPEANVGSVVAVFPDLIFSPDFTSEENFAIFLHEIGHNFQNAANNTLYSLNLVTSIISAFTFPITSLVLNDLTYNIVNFIQNKLSSVDILGKLYSIVSICIYTYTKAISIIRGWQDFFLMPLGYILSFLNKLEKFLYSLLDFSHVESYLDERFADGFAASYGYGGALASALEKMSLPIVPDPILDDLISKMPIVGHIMEALCIPGMMLIGIIDVHPRTASRLYSIIKDLKQDLNDPSLSPEMKKQLQKDIDEYEKAIKTYFDDKTDLKNPRMISANIQKWMYDRGGDIKFKISELPYIKTGGFRAETNRTAEWIEKDRYNIKNLKNVKII